MVNVIGLSSVLAILAGMRLHRPAAAAWWLFAAGQFLFFAGDLYTYGFQGRRRIPLSATRCTWRCIRR